VKAVHAAILLFALVAVAICLPEITWPWYLFIPLSAYVGSLLFIPSLRRSLPRMKLGRCDLRTCGVALGYSVLTTGVLLAFQEVFQPDIAAMLARMPIAWLGGPLLAGLCFSLGNAILEELIFRWSLYEALAEEWGERLAVLFTAIMFGIGHFQGYPPGWVGACLAGGYGVGLGLLRWWTGGVALCVACHICADATIFVIALGNR